MPTRTITRTLNHVDVFVQRQTLKNNAEALKRRADSLGTKLKDFIKANFDYENDQGSRFVEFSETVEVEGTLYKALEARRSSSSSLDLDAAEKFLQKKGLYEEALTPVLDPDKIMLLVQRGKISAKDIDKLMVESESWSLWPVKGEVDA